MDDIKNKIENVINTEVKRAGKDKLLKFLADSDYYTAPASTVHHACYPGGLAEHSYSVYELLKQKNQFFPTLKYSEETIALVGLCHDLCKVNFYKIAKDEPATPAQVNYLKVLSGVDDVSFTKAFASKLIEWYKGGKVGPLPLDVPVYEVDEALPLGHGEKSLYLLSTLMEVTPEEAMAIRWHMIAFDAGIHFSYPSGLAFKAAVKKCPLITALFTSDYESSNLYNL